MQTHLPEECAKWLDSLGGDLTEAWRTCPRADWLLAMALAAAVDRTLVVHAAHEIASAALARRVTEDPSANRALRLALAWVEGRATSSEAWAGGFSAMEAADRVSEDATLSAAIRAAAFVAFACDDLADATFYLHRSYASKAAEQAAIALEGDDAKWAAHVRARIPLATFLAAYELASQPPPPNTDGGDEEEPPSDGFYT